MQAKTGAPTWFQVARRPKWIGGLLVAMLVAAGCALLAQWQLGRSVEAPIHTEETSATALAHAPAISAVIRPGLAPRSSAVGTLVSAKVTVDPAAVWVVGNRYQSNGSAGYWVVSAFTDSANNQLVAPLGFTPSRRVALRVASQLRSGALPISVTTLHGRLSPSEAPQQMGSVLNSLSLGQLANLLPASQGTRLYPLFLLVTDKPSVPLEQIRVTRLTTAQINWLSAFYALEWAAFCGFSFFMWWRLVRDQQRLEAADSGDGQQ